MRRKKALIRAIIAVSLLALVLSGTRVRPNEGSPVNQVGQFKPAQGSPWVQKTIASMSLDEKIGQLIIPATVGMFLSQDSDVFAEIRRNITEFHVGGYHMLGENTTLHEPAGVALLINRMQEMARLPLLITADFEGGVGIRYTGATRLPRGMALGAAGSEDMAYQAGKITAEEARAVGIGVNFYPVADVNSNARNPIINIRSFGGDPAQVSKMTCAYIRGSQDAGEMATAKHFPGHGDTSTDSHLELPVIDADRSRLDSTELPPFKAAIDQGVGGVMSAHIALPRIDSSRMPATLSKKLLSGLLRDDLGFRGVIFTDAMTMRGIAAHYPEGEAAAQAVKAGADVVLYPTSVEKAFLGIKQAVSSGEITESRLDESVRRILSAKAGLGLDRNRVSDINKLDSDLGTNAHRLAAQRMIESAITLVRDQRAVLPLRLSPDQSVLFVNLLDNKAGWPAPAPGSTFLAELLKRHPKTTAVEVSDSTSLAEFNLVRKLASLSDVIITCGFIRVAAYKGSVDLSAGQIDLLRHLSSSQKPFAFVLYGSPYLISFVPELPTYVLAYEYYPGAEEAALRAVLGEIEFAGKLPIDLPGLYKIGYSAAPRH